MDSAIFEKIEHQKIEALIHKKKHINAADRKRKYHHKLGVSAVVISFSRSPMLPHGTQRSWGGMQSGRASVQFLCRILDAGAS
jgi:hypothetical protein